MPSVPHRLLMSAVEVLVQAALAASDPNQRADERKQAVAVRLNPSPFQTEREPYVSSGFMNGALARTERWGRTETPEHAR